MYHVKKTLSEMPDTLELDSYYSWLEGECPELGAKVGVCESVCVGVRESVTECERECE